MITFYKVFGFRINIDSPSSPPLRVEWDDCVEVAIRVSIPKKAILHNYHITSYSHTIFKI